MGRGLRGVRKAKRLENITRCEQEKMENLSKMRKAVEESNVICKDSLQQLIDLQELSKMDCGDEEQTLHKLTVNGIKYRLKRRNKDEMDGKGLEDSLEKRTKENETREVMNMVITRNETL